VGPRNHVLGGGPISPWEGAILRGEVWHSAVSCAKMADPIEMLFGLWARVCSRNHVLDGGREPAMGRSNFQSKGWPIVKYRDALP